MPRADWTVEDVAGLLRDQEGARRKSCLLIGAGVSRSAGVGTSADFVALIKAKHAIPYARAQRNATNDAPTYVQCMDELTEGQQAILVRDQVEQARINWAHIGIARLEFAGYVDRILTTNFDPLASRACALFNRFPAVYDLAALRDAETDGGRARFLPSFVRGSAIYHLHGQHTGFMLLNTQEKLERQASRIEPALEEAVDDRTVIICGYSGENDPLVDRLSRQDVFPHGLIWVCHNDESPCTEVLEKLVERIDDCHLVRNMPADRFFTELANALDLPQPPFLTQPFQHMLTVLDHVRPYSDLTDNDLDLLQHARNLLVAAASGSKEESPNQNEIADLMAQENFAEVFDKFAGEAQERSESERELIAWAAIMLGNALYDQAKQMQGKEADALFAQAEEKYATALEIKPNKQEALYNWAVALSHQARLKQGEEADFAFTLAKEKYASAVSIRPDDHDALNNWGTAIADQANLKHGEDADTLFAEAGEKYAAALAIKPDKDQALYNWGNTLFDQARLKQGEDAAILFTKAGEKYAAALAINPDKHEALYNWGNAFFHQARLKQGDEAEGLFVQAVEKYAAALVIKPDKHEALCNWAVALSKQAGLKQGHEADALFAEAKEKYAAALVLKPEEPDTLNAWANLLIDQARTKTEPDSRSLLEEAEQKLLAAHALGSSQAAYNLACVSAMGGKAREAAEWLQTAKVEGSLPDCAFVGSDRDFDQVRGDPVFVQALQAVGCGPDTTLEEPDRT